MREKITSRHNPLLAHFKKLLTVRAYRTEHREFAADGVKLLAEAVRWGCPLTAVLVQEGVELPEVPAGVRVAEVSEALMRSVSLMEAPQGALFACRMPEDAPAEVTLGCVVLEGIQDPGNLGTILRTADALDVPVILTEGCADAYNPKVVRASMGAVLRTPPRGLKKSDVVRACREQGVQLLATAMSADARDVRAAACRNGDRQRGARRVPGVAGGGGRQGHHPHERPLRITQRGSRGDDRDVADAPLSDRV